ASFEPTLDYIVVKIPRFAFEKFPEADARLTTTMKSVGEAMAFGRSFPEALQKAMRSLEKKNSTFTWKFSESKEELLKAVQIPTEHRLIQVQRALAAGATVREVHLASGIDPWFLQQIMEINEQALAIKIAPDLNESLLRKSKRLGFSDQQIAEIRDTTAIEISRVRERLA
ncbi:MAG: carbamoyl phosphate synthase large subunit, partial [bacterium]